MSYNYAFWTGKGHGTIMFINMITEDEEVKKVCERYLKEYGETFNRKEV